MSRLSAAPKLPSLKSWRRVLKGPSPGTVIPPKRRLEALMQTLGRSGKDQIGPALLLATSAGVAFWWWTQWARGSAESETGDSPPSIEDCP